MTKEEILARIEKLQRRWQFHAVEHRERRDNNAPYYNAYEHGIATGYLKALNTFKDWTNRLDSLPEQPVGKTCKTCGFYENNCPFIRGKFIPYPNKVCKDYTYSVMKAQEQPEGLEEAAEWHFKTHYPDCSWEIKDGVIADFIAGAEWMKAKMMEEAVEGVVCYGSKGAYIETDFLGEYDTDVYGDSGDKVKIIIVKEDEK